MTSTDLVFVDDNLPKCNAAALNGYKNENTNLILNTGQTGSTADNNQTSKAVAVYASRGDFYQEAGGSAADVYVLENVGSLQQLFELKDGMRVRFEVVNANTGASTVNVNTLGAKNIFFDGSALIVLDLVIGDIVTLIFDEGNDRFNLVNSSSAITSGNRANISGILTAGRFTSGTGSPLDLAHYTQTIDGTDISNTFVNVVTSGTSRDEHQGVMFGIFDVTTNQYHVGINSAYATAILITGTPNATIRIDLGASVAASDIVKIVAWAIS